MLMTPLTRPAQHQPRPRGPPGHPQPGGAPVSGVGQAPIAALWEVPLTPLGHEQPAPEYGLNPTGAPLPQLWKPDPTGRPYPQQGVPDPTGGAWPLPGGAAGSRDAAWGGVGPMEAAGPAVDPRPQVGVLSGVGAGGAGTP